MTEDAKEFMESGIIPVTKRRILLTEWVGRAWAELERTRKELARNNREHESIFFKAFARTGALRRSSGKGDEEIRMSLAPSDWYKKLSEDLGPAPAAPPSRQKKRAAKRKRSEVRPDHEESQQQPEPSSESESGSDIESEEPSDTSDFSDSDIGEVQQLTREQVWSTQLLFDSIHEDKFRARVANEYTKLCNALDRPPTNKQKDRFEMQAHATVTEEDRIASGQQDNQSRPLRNAAAHGQKGMGGGFYSSSSSSRSRSWF
jgi:hypothetical protein